MKKYTNAHDLIGQKVAVVFDRPLGTKHPKHDFIYELNYGYIPEALSPDDEELDAYYLSANTPLEKVEGICIGYIKRDNDQDDKLLVVKEGDNYSDEEIVNLVSFQEKWFTYKIIKS